MAILVRTEMDYLRYSHIGLVFALLLCGFFYGGYLLDNTLGTKPLFTFAGILLGFASGMYFLIKNMDKKK